MPIRKILVANRSEIAIRVFRAANELGMKTVAEWVDNEADAMLLKGLGVDYLQGFMIGKPETAPAWLPDGAPNQAPSKQVRINAAG